MTTHTHTHTKRTGLNTHIVGGYITQTCSVRFLSLSLSAKKEVEESSSTTPKKLARPALAKQFI